MEVETVSNSSDEDEKPSKVNFPELQGYLSKWTNYINGWQKRWIVLKDGTLSYYRSESEIKFGCRGAVSMFKAFVKAHEYDDCRFDVKVNDYTLCLRASTPSERNRWLKSLCEFKSLDSGYVSENSLKSIHSSAEPISSSSPIPFVAYATESPKELNKKVTELETLETLKESVVQQLNNLQTYLKPDDKESPIKGTEKQEDGDFKYKVLTFQTTAGNFMDRLNHCLTSISPPDESTKCLNGTAGENYYTEEINASEIRRHSSLNDPSLEKLNVKDDGDQTSVERTNHNTGIYNNALEPTIKIRNHRLWPEIDEVTKEQVLYARMGLGKDAWQLFADEGEMKMYRREEEQNGLAVDPLKACHFVYGFTAHEICHYFFRPEVRYEWETTLETNGMTVLETISDDGIIFHQVHKRIWPVAQRDAVFWSHLRQVPLESTDDASIHDAWVVVNHSTDMAERPANTGKLVRIFMTVCLFCQTVILSDKSVDKLSRKDIACKINYCSVVNPGGWAPSSALRIVYKREYPRFLRKFTAYVTNKTKESPIMF